MVVTYGQYTLQLYSFKKSALGYSRYYKSFADIVLSIKTFEVLLHKNWISIL